MEDHMNHLQAEGTLIPYYMTKSFIEKPLLPENLPIGHVIDPNKFIEKQAFTKSLYADKVRSRIEIRTPEELKNATCLEFYDGEGFVAVTETGEVISVLKSPASKMQNFLGIAFANAIMVGGSRLDCYDCDNLGPTYCRRGFIPICRIDFDREMCAHEMLPYYNDPEVVFFMYCGDPVYTFWQKMQDGEYMSLGQYEYIPHITEVQKSIGEKVNGKDYDFAGRFRDMVWGRWNGGLKSDFMFRPNKLMYHICNDSERLKLWMKDQRYEA